MCLLVPAFAVALAHLQLRGRLSPEVALTSTSAWVGLVMDPGE